MKSFFKRTINIILGITVGIVISNIVVYAANTISASDINYTNSNLQSDNVQDAIDELYSNTQINKKNLNVLPNIVVAYNYEENKEASNYCVTGDEKTCERTTCYMSKEQNSCTAGTIIVYKVNDHQIVRFHVMFDNGEKITMQSQQNIIYNTEWYKDSKINTAGPETILKSLETTTANWSNINDQIYSIGDNNTLLGYSGCDTYNSCTKNTYNFTSRIAKSRMMTVQEATTLKCTTAECPIWMYNYLETSTLHGGTMDDKGNLGSNNSYWLMNAADSPIDGAWVVYHMGVLNITTTWYASYGARAVVEISK